MNKSGAKYNARYSESFQQHKTDRQLRELAKKIKSKCELICEQPYTACDSERLKHDLTGKRSGNLFKQWCIIYKVCKECRKRDEEGGNHLVNCLDCAGVPDKTINFLCITNYH